MQPLQFAVPLDALEVLEPFITYIILGLVLVNMVTRILAHRKHVNQAEDGDDDEELSRFLPHSVTTVLLVLASFIMLLLEPHGGMVMSVLALGLLLTDFFEYESRRVEARTDKKIEKPKAAVGASVLLLMYAAFQALFFLVADYWNAVV
ncbi:DUF7313 family protein [Halopelagius longus]|uniref:DUF7313 domain-containing protein n=1 Tax=Halopelagius longus TaxID=1236180 RepID=A0A1H1D2C7_9EURY|nr:hypothetical protein [Halopelagius longus]RDI71137.1 hypothetical protein DWB78_05005 [Halopelagius longus]SDQ70675.1 hypothetical protein SAMN05216278_2196 [Halopelagius longus]